MGVVEAAGLLGQSTDAIVSAPQRHALKCWRDNRGEWRVPVTALSPLLDGGDDGQELVLGFLPRLTRSPPRRSAAGA